jgi:hypothetical protein
MGVVKVARDALGVRRVIVVTKLTKTEITHIKK